MINVNITIKPGETATDIIEQICQSENIDEDTAFAFSAIMTPSSIDADCYDLKINCLMRENPYTPRDIVNLLYYNDAKISYVNPPLDLYFQYFKPSLSHMVNKAYPYYSKCIPEREELLSILYLVVVQLHNKNYYLYKNLIYKSFINALNVEIRKIKNFTDTISLDDIIRKDPDGNDVKLADLIPDRKASAIAHQQTHYTEKDYREDMFEQVKAAMLEEMSQLSFDRILIQLKSRSIEKSTTVALAKFRERFTGVTRVRGADKWITR